MNIVGELKYYLDEGVAQLKFSESSTAFSIDIVLVPSSQRNKGVGTFLIQHILYLADIMKKKVNLSARPIGNYSPENLQKLVLYYEKFGFSVIDTGSTVAYMMRLPKGRQEEHLRDAVQSEYNPAQS